MYKAFAYIFCLQGKYLEITLLRSLGIETVRKAPIFSTIFFFPVYGKLTKSSNIIMMTLYIMYYCKKSVNEKRIEIFFFQHATTVQLVDYS